jgi:mannose-6-phosphate isomerase
MSLREPLRFVPRCHEKVWGGSRLAAFLRGTRGGTVPIGEVWTLVDRPGESSRVDGGRHAGRSLSELVHAEGSACWTRARSDGFPLLVKLLDTGEKLSVQVHPDARTAARLARGAQGKTECWYVLSARAEARLHLGLKPGVSAARLRASAGSSALVDLLEEWPVEAGNFVFVPAGTVHSIGAGITLVEIQESPTRPFDSSTGGASVRTGSRARPPRGCAGIDRLRRSPGSPVVPVARDKPGRARRRARHLPCSP